MCFIANFRDTAILTLANQATKPVNIKTPDLNTVSRYEEMQV